MQQIKPHKECIAIKTANNESSICNSCLKNQLESWLKIRRPKLIPSTRKKIDIFFKESNYSNKIICSICNKKENTCDFCFRKYIQKWFKENYPRLAIEFTLFSLNL